MTVQCVPDEEMEFGYLTSFQVTVLDEISGKGTVVEEQKVEERTV